jgi:hypothetical protein
VRRDIKGFIALNVVEGDFANRDSWKRALEGVGADDLRRVAAIEFQPGLDCYKALCDAVDPDNEFSEMEIKRYLFGDERFISDVFDRRPTPSFFLKIV